MLSKEICLPQDKFPDPTLLDISDVELHDLLLFEEDPTIVVKFSCQQINCFRDRFGNVVDGSPDSVHRVLYVWALRQVSLGRYRSCLLSTEHCMSMAGVREYGSMSVRGAWWCWAAGEGQLCWLGWQAVPTTMADWGAGRGSSPETALDPSICGDLHAWHTCMPGCYSYS